MKGCQV